MPRVEQWAVIGCAENYDVSDQGRVRSRITGHIRKFQTLNSGYLKVDLKVGDRTITRTVHRLVACAFCDNPQRKSEVNHRDGDRHNNRADNLEWVTRVENMMHAVGSARWRAATWRTSSTGVRGVTPHADGGFIARTTINGTRAYLGYFKTVEDAAAAIQQAKGRA